MKISIKIFATILSILVPSLIALGVSVPLTVEDNMITEAENKLIHDRKVAEVLVNQTLSAIDIDEFRKKSIEIASNLRDITGLRVSVYDNSMILADSSNIQDNMTTEVKNALKGLVNYRRTKDYLYFAFPIENFGAVRLAYPLDSISDVVSRTTFFIICIGTFVTAAALAAAAILSRKLSVPVVKLDHLVKRIRQGDYDVDIDIKSNDEIGNLAASFKDMSDTIKLQIKELGLMVENEKKLKNIERGFISSVTHEFKTPLTSIIGYTDLLSEYKDDPKLFDDAVRVIKSEGQRLHQMVERVLYLSRMEKYDFEMNLSKVDVKILAQKSVEGVRIKSQNADISMNLTVSCSSMVQGDFDMLIRMLVNLLDNSIKYNVKNGRVDFSVEEMDDTVVFTISDTGVGIGSDDLEKVFQPFYRVDKNRSRKIGGDGLGLSIVSDIVKKHNGNIAMESTPGKGTKVTIKLPACEGGC